MLEAYSNDLSLTTGTDVVFNRVPVETVNTRLSSDGTTVKIASAGVYKVTFSASVSTAIITSGTGTFTLVVSGDNSAKGFAEQTLSSSAEYSYSFSTLIKVVLAPLGQMATISVNYTGPAVNADLVDIVVTKVA